MKFTETLREAGVSEQQAKAGVKAISSAFGQVLDAQVATTADLVKLEARLESKINEIKATLKLHGWMLGLVVIVEIIPLLKALLHD